MPTVTLDLAYSFDNQQSHQGDKIPRSLKTKVEEERHDRITIVHVVVTIYGDLQFDGNM